jgi:hypothetical protein
MRTRIGIVVAAAAVAVAGCGGDLRAGGHTGGPGAAPSAQQAPDAQRTQDLVALTPAQAARRAQRIALVVSRGSRVIEGAPGTPFTRTTFAVEDVLKGRLPRRFVLQVIGGRLGDRVVTSAVPAFARSSRYVLFLGPDGPVGPTIFPQAVLDVTRVSRPRLHDVLFSIRRYLHTTGGSR